MEQYIQKSALVAEIENMIPPRAFERETLHSEFVRGQIVAYNKVLSSLDTIEVKEVDLNEEIEKCLKQHNMLALGKKDFTNIAKHFFELGLKAQKGE